MRQKRNPVTKYVIMCVVHNEWKLMNFAFYQGTGISFFIIFSDDSNFIYFIVDRFCLNRM